MGQAAGPGFHMGIGPNKELIEPNFIMGGETKYVGLAYREGSKKNFVL